MNNKVIYKSFYNDFKAASKEDGDETLVISKIVNWYKQN